MERQDVATATTEKKAAALRYLDGLFWSGTFEQMKLHHRILSHLAKNGEKSESKLANWLGLNIRSAILEEALSGLESRGLITRRTKEWGHRGEWIDLSDDCRQAFITSKGSYFGSQSLRQLGLDQ